MDTGEEAVISVLTRYVSPILARSVFTTALRRAGIRERALVTPHMTRLAPLLADGAKLFMDAALYADLKRQLEELGTAEPATKEQLTRLFSVTTERDISTVRSAARGAAEKLGARLAIAQRIATAVSELARNIVSYTPGGEIELIALKVPRMGMLVRATDSGNGIPNLDEILGGSYKSSTGLGVGIKGTRRLADRFDIQTGSSGTRIEAEFHF